MINSNRDPEKYSLNPDELSYIYKNEVSVDVFTAALSVEQPKLIMLGGQPGARKTALQHSAEQEFAGSGGYRTTHYYTANDVPIFLLPVFGKETTDNLTKAERNKSSKVLPQLAGSYRQGVKQIFEVKRSQRAFMYLKRWTWLPSVKSKSIHRKPLQIGTGYPWHCPRLGTGAAVAGPRSINFAVYYRERTRSGDQSACDIGKDFTAEIHL